MTDPEEYRLLAQEPLRRAVHENLHRDPLEVALDGRVPHARLVATQVKYLRRAGSKLPSYAAAECLLPPRAFEQASSEETARHKRIGGDTLLELTCGLGVDTQALARRFRRVVTIERDEGLAWVARENFSRLGITNVEVVTADAADYLARTEEHFDWIYADPDRRDAEGRRRVLPAECSPDVEALMPLIRRRSGGLCLKLSPLFDVGEALRLFPRSEVETVSAGGECKEVVVYADGREPRVTATALGRGSYGVEAGEWCVELPAVPPCPLDECRYLVIPDAALRKSRLVRRYLAASAWVESENGYGFAVTKPAGGVLGRIFEIQRVMDYEPKRLRRRYGGRGCVVYRQEFPLHADGIARRLGLGAGDEFRLAFTRVGDRHCCIELGKELTDD